MCLKYRFPTRDQHGVELNAGFRGLDIIFHPESAGTIHSVHLDGEKQGIARNLHEKISNYLRTSERKRLTFSVDVIFTGIGTDSLIFRPQGDRTQMALGPYHRASSRLTKSELMTLDRLLVEYFDLSI